MKLYAFAGPGFLLLVRADNPAEAASEMHQHNAYLSALPIEDIIEGFELIEEPPWSGVIREWVL